PRSAWQGSRRNPSHNATRSRSRPGSPAHSVWASKSSYKCGDASPTSSSRPEESIPGDAGCGTFRYDLRSTMGLARSRRAGVVRLDTAVEFSACRWSLADYVLSARLPSHRRVVLSWRVSIDIVTSRI